MTNQYVGQVVDSLSRPGLHLAETSYRNGQRVGSHMHNRPLVVVVLAGAMNEHVGGRVVSCRAGTVLLHPAGEAHAHRFGDQGARCLVLQFGRSWLERLSGEEELALDRPASGMNEAVTTAGRLLHREFRRREGAHPAALDGLALTLLASLTRGAEPEPGGRRDFLELVLEQLQDDIASDVDLSTLAQIADVSPGHLARTFRQEMGCTVGAYVRRLRVERARRALEDGDLSLSRLALDLGFYDQSHFTRTFKAHVGCPPGEYRHRIRS